MSPAPAPKRQPARQSMLHEAIDIQLLALHEAHRSLARAPVDFLERSGALTPPLVALGRWQDAMLRTGYFSLIAMNRLAGALAARALAALPGGMPPAG